MKDRSRFTIEKARMDDTRPYGIDCFWMILGVHPFFSWIFFWCFFLFFFLLLALCMGCSIELGGHDTVKSAGLSGNLRGMTVL